MLKILLKQLYTLNDRGARKNGLENVRRLCSLLGDPQKNYPSIHIAGTNGKGSVATKIAAALAATGKRTALFTSPHIHCFSERYRVNDIPIPLQELEESLTKIFLLREKYDIPATFFEVTTAIAFDYFSRQKVDVAVIEVGLGGTLDSTNIIDPMQAIITSIGLDHTEVLGNSIEEITLHKAGIIKLRVPVIIGPTVPYGIIAPIAKQLNCELYQTGSYPSFQEENKELAKQSLIQLGVGFSSESLDKEAESRMEVMSHDPLIIVDVAHNPPAIRKLFETLSKTYVGVKFDLVLGLSEEKNLQGCLDEAAPFINKTKIIPLPVNKWESVPKSSFNDFFPLKAPTVICGSFRIIQGLKSCAHFDKPSITSEFSCQH